jgi:hypothetical protein
VEQLVIHVIDRFHPARESLLPVFAFRGRILARNIVASTASRRVKRPHRQTSIEFSGKSGNCGRRVKMNNRETKNNGLNSAPDRELGMQGQTAMNIQFDRISWTCPITEAVSLLTDVTRNDVDLSW